MANSVQITQLSAPLPEGSCYLWRPDILWLHAGSNTAIALAHLLIAATLVLFLRKSKVDLPHKDIVTLFAVLVLCTAVTNLAEVLTTWLPYYLLEGWVKAVTASVAMTTGLVFVSKIPDLLRSESALKQLETARKEIASLENQLNQMNSIYQAALGREERIVQLKKEVNQELFRQGKAGRYKIYTGNE